jgi:amidase
LPIGLQIVGRHHCDLDVLKLAHAFERATRLTRRRRPDGLLADAVPVTSIV